jgi:hypothetical protein
MHHSVDAEIGTNNNLRNVIGIPYKIPELRI